MKTEVNGYSHISKPRIETHVHIKILSFCAGILTVAFLFTFLFTFCAAADAQDASYPPFTFGSYPQTETGNDSTPVEWLLLDTYDNGSILAVSRYVMCQRSWSSRASSSFSLSVSPEERNNYSYSIKLLSLDQAHQYGLTVCEATPYARSQGVVEKNGKARYWLSPGSYDYNPYYMWGVAGWNGCTLWGPGSLGQESADNNIGFRPAIVISPKNASIEDLIPDDKNLDVFYFEDHIRSFYDINGTLFPRTLMETQNGLSVTLCVCGGALPEGTLAGSVNVSLPEGFSFAYNEYVQSKSISLSRGDTVRLKVYPMYNVNASTECTFMAISGQDEYSITLPITPYADANSVTCRSSMIRTENFSFTGIKTQVNIDPIPDYINTSASTYNYQLAYMGSALSQAAYNHDYITKSLFNLGYQNIKTFGYDTSTYQGIACAMGIRSVIAGSEITHQLAITIRGTYDLEWTGDFVIANGTAAENLHSNFAACASNVLSWLAEYIPDEINIRQTNLFVTGHSRGAAVADIFTHHYASSLPSNKTVCYTFAAPNSTTTPAEDSNIFNIVNVNDLVAYVPAGGYGKYGRTIAFDPGGESNANRALIGLAMASGQDMNWLLSRRIVSKAIGDYLASMKGVPVYDGGLGAGIYNIWNNHGAEMYLSNVPQGTGTGVSWESAKAERKTYFQSIIENSSGILGALTSVTPNRIVSRVVNILLGVLTDRVTYNISVACPVNVTVTDQTGSIVARFDNHNLTSLNESIAIGESEGETDYLVVISAPGKEYNVKIDAQNNGTMDVLCYKTEKSLEIQDSVSMENVEIQNGYSYSFSVNENSLLSDTKLISEIGKAYVNALWSWKINVALSEGETTIVPLIIPISGKYHFETIGVKDTVGYIYDEKRIMIASDDDGGENRNFRITKDFSAGQKINIGVRYYSSGSGNEEVLISVDGDIPIYNVSLRIPDGVSLIGEEAFLNIGSRQLQINADCESIGVRAFADSQIQTAFIPSTVKYIDNSAFDGCNLIVITDAYDSYVTRWATENNIPGIVLESFWSYY